MIDGLSFKMPLGASYAVGRRGITYHPQNSNMHKPTGGTKSVRILLTGGSWIDPSTYRSMFDVRNNAAAAKKLYVVGGPH